METVPKLGLVGQVFVLCDQTLATGVYVPFRTGVGSSVDQTRPDDKPCWDAQNSS